MQRTVAGVNPQVLDVDTERRVREARGDLEPIEDVGVAVGPPAPADNEPAVADVQGPTVSLKGTGKK